MSLLTRLHIGFEKTLLSACYGVLVNTLLPRVLCHVVALGQRGAR
jgi:hypothetical protein